MAAATLRKQEGAGLIVALTAHAGLIAWLALWQPDTEVIEPPESISVTLSDEVGLVATTPDPSADPAPATAPMQGEVPPPPAPEPVPTPDIRPQPQPVARVVPTPPRPVPKPVTRATPKRDTMADLLDRRLPTKPPAKPPAKPPGKPPTKPPAGNPGTRDFDKQFGPGIPGATGTGGPPVATGEQKDSWKSLIGAKVARFLNACPINGLDVEKLRVDVRFTLALDGSIQSLGEAVVLPSSITEANRSQVAPFKACALKAIKLAAPFTGLPRNYYNDWKLRNMRLRIQ